MSTHWSFGLPTNSSSYAAFGTIAVFTFKIKEKTCSLVVDKIFCASSGCVLSSTDGMISVYGARIRQVDHGYDSNTELDAIDQERCFYRDCLSSTLDLFSYLNAWFTEWDCTLPAKCPFFLRKQSKDSNIEIASRELQWTSIEEAQKNKAETEETSKTAPPAPAQTSTHDFDKWTEIDSAMAWCWGSGIFCSLSLLLLCIGLCTNVLAMIWLGGIGTTGCAVALICSSFVYSRLKRRKNE